MRIAQALLAAAVLALGVSACNTDDLPPAAQFGSLSGLVVDSVTTKPIAGAVVTVDAILSVTTGADGKFSFDRVPAGDYDYTVTAQGYTTISSSAQADAGKALTLNLALVAASPAPSPESSP